tara:strand:+ start:185 stop:433 length:249 start_codon:yes stop_codon:yes gene_type:complete
MSSNKIKNHLIPQTLYQALYLVWFVICFFAVWIGTLFVNYPLPVFGLPIVFVWASSWGALWLIGCIFLGLKIDKERAARKGS